MGEKKKILLNHRGQRRMGKPVTGSWKGMSAKVTAKKLAQYSNRIHKASLNTRLINLKGLCGRFYAVLAGLKFKHSI